VAVINKDVLFFYLLSFSYFSTGFVVFKVYPFFFLSFSILFIYFYYKEVFFPYSFFKIVFMFVVLLLFSFVNESDAIFQLKFFTNIFFLFTVYLFLKIIFHSRILFFLNIFKVFVVVFLVFNFINVFYIVLLNDLWLNPFSISSSSDAFFIQSEKDIYFGADQKNIWASKIAVGFIFFVTLNFILGGKKIFSFPSVVVYLISLFSIVYTSSRVAQIAIMLFIVLFFFHAFFYNKKRLNKFGLILALFFFIGVFFFVIQSFIRFDPSSVDIGVGNHQGDGFLARIIIWYTVFEGVAYFDLFQFLFGNGILSFSSLFPGFEENNPHNVFISYFLDFGFIGLFFFIYLLMFFSNKKFFNLFYLWVPFFALIFFQYSGYDTEIVFYLIFIYIVSFLINIRASGDEL
jgi:hypothetical protein